MTEITHREIQGDSSFMRNDYYLADDDDYSINSTLFEYMQAICRGNFNHNILPLHKYQRYQRTLVENGKLTFGPQSLLPFGAASFLNELFPPSVPPAKQTC